MEHWKLIILNVYQNAGIEKDNDSRQSLEYHAKIDEMRRFTNKNSIDKGHDVHRAMTAAKEYSKPYKQGEYQDISGVMGISYKPFVSSEASAACMNFEVTELLKF